MGRFCKLYIRLRHTNKTQNTRGNIILKEAIKMFASGIRSNTLPLKMLRRSLQTNSQAGAKDPSAASSERQKAIRHKDRVLREEFLQSEIEWEKRVDYKRLTEREVTIHEKHNEAVKNLHL